MIKTKVFVFSRKVKFDFWKKKSLMRIFSQLKMLSSLLSSKQLAKVRFPNVKLTKKYPFHAPHRDNASTLYTGQV